MSATENKSLEKWVPSLATKEELYDALDKAFDYRGDITIKLKDGTSLVGYVFNRTSNVAEPFIEMFPADKDVKTKVFYKDIASLAFTGIDTAAGKSWAAWVEKYKAKESGV
ncbi:MAG TPA: hypothetical protein VEK08_15110 [Planctomycetota bacterium]|nr:hypothetical protein [Planctomycetota bacterium]